MRRQQQKEIAAAEDARQARRAAVATWLAEEERLQRRRDVAKHPDKDASEIGDGHVDTGIVKTPTKRRHSVTFADDVLVTEIPAAAGETLPTPVSSPIGVAVSESAIAKQRLGDMMVGVGNRRVPKRGRFVTVAEEWSDSSDDDDDDPEFVPALEADGDAVLPVPCPARRIRPMRVPGGPGSSEEEPNSDGSTGGKVKKQKKNAKLRRPDVQQDKPSANDDKPHAFKNDDARQEPVSPVLEDGIEKASPQSFRKKMRKLSPSKGSPTTTSPGNDSSAADKPERPANGHASSPRAPRDGDEEEIDSLFGDLVKHRAAKKARIAWQAAKEQQAGGSPKPVKNGNTKKQRDFPARYTEDGLRIVTYDEMAADQPKGLKGACPFDCSCCF